MVKWYYVSEERITKEGKHSVWETASTINEARAKAIKSFVNYRYPSIPVTKNVYRSYAGFVVRTDNKAVPYVWETYRRFGGLDKRYVLNKDGSLGRRL